MDDEITKLLAEKYFKEDINDWAIKCLERGYDSKSLRILASMSKCDSDSELDNYFQRSLKELGWNKIEKQDYLMSYAKILAREIIEEKSDPIKASRKIYQILVDLDYPTELHGWFEIDEMIYDYKYFLKTRKQGYYFLPKAELIKVIKKISTELTQKKKFRNYVSINSFQIKTARRDERFKAESYRKITGNRRRGECFSRAGKSRALRRGCRQREISAGSGRVS